ncbi:hypothetical protein [Cellulosimicrobium sp. Marseille-Q8652]
MRCPEDFAPRLVAAYQEAGSVHLTMSVDAGGQSMRAEGSMVLGEASSDLVMVTEIPGQGSVEMRYVDGVAYMNLGETTGGGFLRIDPSDASDPMAPMVEELEAQADPTQSVRDLDGAIVSIASTGSEEVDGVPTTVYDVVVDTTKVTGAMADQVAQARDMIPERVTYHYWLDADDRMRKVSFDMAGGSTTLQMTGWGEVGTIEAPAESELVDPATLGG